jgi:hypothetical protein
MTYNFDYQILKNGQPYGFTETAAVYLSNYLYNRVSSDKPLLEARIAGDLLTSPDALELDSDERTYFLNIILALGVDNYTKNKLAFPLVQDVVDGVPVMVTRWQLRAQLAIQGLEANVTAAINALPSSTPEETDFKIKAQYAWEAANNILRLSPTVEMIQAVLGLTNLEVDEIFIEAYKISI